MKFRILRSLVRLCLLATILVCYVGVFTLQHEIQSLFAEELKQKQMTLKHHFQITKSVSSTIPKQSRNNSAPSHYVKETSYTAQNISDIVNTGANPTSLQLPQNFPKWMRRYFNWHRKLRFSLNKSNWQDHKYLILRCTYEDAKCGGLADRIKPLPYFLLLASKHKRIFLIRWTKPMRLEEFLLPNKLNWSVPEWMSHQIEIGNVTLTKSKNSAKKFANFRSIDKKATVVEGRFQDILGGASYYENIVSDPTETYEKIYHNVFRSLFKASPPVEKLIQAKIASDNLIPGEFAVAHYRAFYAIEDKKHEQALSTLQEQAINAVNCASVLRPGGPVYFASDSKVAIETVYNYSLTNKLPISMLESEDEALHIDKFGIFDHRPAKDFYSVFVDLLLMAEGNCVSFGKGGFGRFATLLSHNSTCSGRHFYKGKVEPCNWTRAND